MKKKKKKMSTASIFFLFLFLIIFCFIIGSLSYNCYDNISKIYSMKLETNKLKDEQLALEEEHKELEKDIKKLNDPDYITKYVREKYLYSKDGEIILRIDE